MTVLIVDDDGGIREVVHRLLVRDFAVNVLEADDGLKALQHLLTERVDMVILDLAMRGMGGIETLEAIRRSPAHATTPVIVLSGQTDETQVVRASKLGITAFIAKPFTIASLRQRLAPLIQNARATSGSSRGPRTSLELDPASHVLVVDWQPEFRSFFRERVHDVCKIDEAEDEPATTRLCTDGVYDALFIGATAIPFLVPAFRETLNRRQRRVPPLIAVVGSTDVEPTRARGDYDDVIVRSFVPETFDWSFYQAAAMTTRARLVFGGSSPGVIALFDRAQGKTAVLLADAVTLESWQRFPETSDRWISAAVELHAAGLAWEVGVRAPFNAALDWSGSWLQLKSDQVSEAQALQVAGLLATELARGLREYAHDRGVDGTIGTPRVRLTRADALARTESGRAGAGRWLLTPRHHPALVVQLTPLAARAV